MQRKSEYIKHLGEKCCVCGSKDDLQFDHIDWRTKSFSIMSKWSIKNQSIVYEELRKCQLLCAKCHRDKTNSDVKEQPKKLALHGTVYSWMKKKCECALCYKAKRKWHDERNKLRRKPVGARGPYNVESTHGTRLTYHRGCRCSLCRKANTLHARTIREIKQK